MRCIEFHSRGEFPPEAKIVVQRHDNLQEYSIPFKVKRIDLPGQPMK